MTPLRHFLLITLLLPLPILADPPAETTNARERAVEFLQALEEKNAGTESLQANFVQVRTDTIFLDEVRSEGRFWWRSPDLFRASLRSEHDSEIWIRDGKMYEYIPALRQVDVVPQAQGDDAAIHQWLLGFGVKVEEIEKRFAVRVLPDAETEEEGWIAIQFLPREGTRSFEYEDIVIHFDEERVEPRRIALDDGTSLITITLQQVRTNPTIRDQIFQLDWPSNVDVIDRSQM